MKIGAVILCRFNSSRLPGKILKEINGKPVLLYIYERLKKIDNLNIIVATSNETSDDPIFNFCNTRGIHVYRGSLNNVSLRFLNAANQHDLDYIIRVNGDNLFIDIETMKYMIGLAKRNAYDFISNVKGRSFPYGMSIEIIRKSFYEKEYPNLVTKYYQEHVTIYFYENPDKGSMFFIYNNVVPEVKGIQLAIDTLEDFKRAQKLVEKLDMNTYDLKEIAKVYE